MKVLDFYSKTRSEFPGITEKADEIHIGIWGEIDPEFAYSWFESLAIALNGEMMQDVDANRYKELFFHISSNFNAGDKEVRNCIDVAFTENLFWRVPAMKAVPYWAIVPEELRKLYVSFHRREPV